MIIKPTYVYSVLDSLFPNSSYALWGDSLSTTGLGYSANFAALYPNVSTSIQGIGGQLSKEIAGRAGAIPINLTVTGNSIPASGGVVCTGAAPDPFYHWNTTNGSIQGTIGGIAGILSWTASVTTFTRTTAGSATAVSNPVVFIPTSSNDETSVNATGVLPLTVLRNRTTVIWAGHNDLFYPIIQGGTPAYNQATTLANIAALVASLNTTRYIIVGITDGQAILTNTNSPGIGLAASDTVSKSYMDSMASLNTQLASIYGTRFLDLKAYIQSQGYTSPFTLNGTSYDIINLTLFPDGTHPTTSLGKNLIANKIQNFLQGLGWAA